MQGPCHGPELARPRAIPSSGMARPFGASAAGQISDVGDGGVARSARTRRSVARGRLEIRRSWNGIVGIGNVLQYRVESVRHDTSPSCRDHSRQGPACPEDNRAVLLSRMPAQRTSRPLGFAALRAGVAMRCLSCARLARAGRSRLETFRQRATIPILLWVLNRHRLLKRRLRAHRRRFARSPRFLNRAGLKIVGAADDLRNTLSGKTRNELIHC